MTFKKRGLGRGLDALLADDSAKEQPYQSQSVPSAKELGRDEMQSTPAVAGEVGVVIGLFKNIQRERRTLLEEAEVLKGLIEEFESVIRAEQS